MLFINAALPVLCAVCGVLNLLVLDYPERGLLWLILAEIQQIRRDVRPPR